MRTTRLQHNYFQRKTGEFQGVDQGIKNGANDRNRTDDLFITSELLYQLSYIGTP